MESHNRTELGNGTRRRTTPLSRDLAQQQTPPAADPPATTGRPNRHAPTPADANVDNGTTPGTPAVRPRTPMRQQSHKRKTEAPLRRKVVTTIKAIQPVCVVPRCARMTVDVHERKTRGRGGSPVNPFNTVGLCREHHDQITAEAKWAYPLGLLVHGWEPEPDEPAPVLSAMQKAAVQRVVEEDWWPTSPYEVEAWWYADGLVDPGW